MPCRMWSRSPRRSMGTPKLRWLPDRARSSPAATLSRVLDAVHGIARHQARIAITVLTHAVPEREPAIIRAALQLVLGLGLNG
jgi:hypothetical protein